MDGKDGATVTATRRKDDKWADVKQNGTVATNGRQPCVLWETDNPIPWLKDDIACMPNAACTGACLEDPKK